MQVAVSPRAKSKVRAYFNRERREDAIERGREAIVRSLRKKRLSYARLASEGHLAAVAADLSYKDVEALFHAVGEGHLAAGTVVNHLANRLDAGDEEVEPDGSPVRVQPTVSDGVIV